MFQAIDQVIEHRLSSKFQVVLVPEYYAQKAKDPSFIQGLANRMGVSIIIDGQCKHGNLRGEENYVFQLKGVVVRTAGKHDELTPEVKHLFRSFRIPLTNDLVGFEFEADRVSLVSRYICGFAALLSGNLQASETLLEDLVQDLHETKLRKRGSFLLDRAKEKLVKVYFGQAYHSYRRYRASRDRARLDSMGMYLQKLRALDPSHAGACNASAIYQILSTRDVNRARRELQGVMDKKNPIWLINDAFIDAYSGDIISAHSKYRRAFRQGIPVEVIADSEEFVHDILSEEPSNTHLLFVLGLMAQYRGDHLSAARDLRAFLDKFAQEHSAERALALTHLNTSEEQLNTG